MVKVTNKYLPKSRIKLVYFQVTRLIKTATEKELCRITSIDKKNEHSQAQTIISHSCYVSAAALSDIRAIH